MQDEINEKTVALYIKTGKLTAEVLQKAIKKLLSQMKKELDRQANPPREADPKAAYEAEYRRFQH